MQHQHPYTHPLDEEIMSDKKQLAEANITRIVDAFASHPKSQLILKGILYRLFTGDLQSTENTINEVVAKHPLISDGESCYLDIKMKAPELPLTFDEFDTFVVKNLKGF